MQYTGVIMDGIVVLDGEPQLADGTVVTVEPVDIVKPEREETTDLAKVLLSFAGKAEGLPEDIAMNHDHYLYGVPKRNE